jgi:hypothetical protein
MPAHCIKKIYIFLKKNIFFKKAFIFYLWQTQGATRYQQDKLMILDAAMFWSKKKETRSAICFIEQIPKETSIFLDMMIDMMIDMTSPWFSIWWSTYGQQLQYWPRKEAPRLSGIDYSQKKIWLILSRHIRSSSSLHSELGYSWDKKF